MTRHIILDTDIGGDPEGYAVTVGSGQAVRLARVSRRVVRKQVVEIELLLKAQVIGMDVVQHLGRQQDPLVMKQQRMRIKRFAPYLVVEIRIVTGSRIIIDVLMGKRAMLHIRSDLRPALGRG